MPFFLSALTTLFIVIDPVGLVPVFIAVASHLGPADRQRAARRSVLVAAGILLVFGLVGRALLDALGIGLPAFYIAGGVLLFLIAIDMLFARRSRTRETPEDEAEALTATDISVFPLAIPIMAGPGSIAAVVLFSTQADSHPLRILSVVLGAGITLLSAYVLMRLCTQIMRVLRQTGIAVVGRVMGVILAALAAQFVLNGIDEFLRTR